MSQDFSEVMSQRSDEQLAEILTLKRDEYQAEALIAAAAEVKKRQLNLADIISPKAEVAPDTEEKTVVADKKDEGLNWALKALTFFFPSIMLVLGRSIFVTILRMPPFSIISFPATIVLQVYIFRELKARGYLKMAKDFKNWTLNSWIVWVSLFILQMLLQMLR